MHIVVPFRSSQIAQVTLWGTIFVFCREYFLHQPIFTLILREMMQFDKGFSKPRKKTLTFNLSRGPLNGLFESPHKWVAASIIPQTTKVVFIAQLGGEKPPTSSSPK